MFKIGMKVVYVGTDLGFDPNPGKTVHTIVGMKGGCCSKNPLHIDVGKRSLRPTYWGCCNKMDYDGIRWKTAKRFRPVQDQYTEAEIEAVNIDEILEVEFQEV